MDNNPELLALLQEIKLDENASKLKYDIKSSSEFSFENYYELNDIAKMINEKNYQK